MNELLQNENPIWAAKKERRGRQFDMPALRHQQNID